MYQTVSMKVIAHIRSDFKKKFGIPRQSGLIQELPSTIVFEPEFQNPDALRGLEEWSHLWLIWQFSETIQTHWSPTVRPPRMGGNSRLGVFVTRSPFRPNAIGLSAVRLGCINYHTPEGPTLQVFGADLMDGSPIFDIKPYLPYADSLPHASCHPAFQWEKPLLEVRFPPVLLQRIPTDRQKGLISALAQDPRPSYHANRERPDRIYGFLFHQFDIQFSVAGQILQVHDVVPIDES